MENFWRRGFGSIGRDLACRSFDIGQLCAPFFGIEVSDFLFLVEKHHRAVQQYMGIDSFAGIRTVRGAFWDLKDRPVKTHRIILGHRAL